MRSNCVLWALPRWLRKAEPGEESYLVIRRSRVPWGILHCLTGKLDKATGQLALESYKPIGDQHKQGFEPVFRGEVVEGDKP